MKEYEFKIEGKIKAEDKDEVNLILQEMINENLNFKITIF